MREKIQPMTQLIELFAKLNGVIITVIVCKSKGKQTIDETKLTVQLSFLFQHQTVR